MEGRYIFQQKHMCTSLQQIVTSHDHCSLQSDIQKLFKRTHYPRFQLQQFYSHHLHDHNDQFHFFIDILQEWNRKIDKQALHNHSDTLFRKNVYIYNNLRNSIMQPIQNADRILSKLSAWYNSIRNSNIRVIQQKKKPESTIDQTWDIRNTFKSNLPAEIDLYHRKVLCSFGSTTPGKENASTQGRFAQLMELRARKVKTENQGGEEVGRAIEQKRIIKIQNEEIRFAREQQELDRIQSQWKIKKNREEEQSVKNFYNGNFSSFKTYFNSKSPSQTPNTPPPRPLMKRVYTSLGFRRSKNSNTPLRYSQSGPSMFHKETSTQGKNRATGLFDEFQQNEFRLSDIGGIHLLSNPSEKKLKKRKRKG